MPEGNRRNWRKQAEHWELTRLLNEKEDAEGMLMDLMEQWDAAQE